MIVASRSLALVSSSGTTRVDVSLYAPELQDELWICRYEIGWPGEVRASFAAGVDSIQALHLALQKVGLELYLSPYHPSGDLRWERAGDGYGFPVPKAGRDMLVGADKSFDG